MSGFEEAVLEVIGSLRPGEVVTYGEVAAEAGFPGAARAVGSILRTSDAEIPWWRVVGAGGQLRSPHPDRQRRLLEEEGVSLEEGKVHVARNHRPLSNRPNDDT
ncbi:MAG TPA: MGMT family protein [Acidimicrobiia bacterium]|nr:MGMT family protein [Acidimicrobiia bacterium]